VILQYSDTQRGITSFTGGVRRALKVLLDGFWRVSPASWLGRAHAAQTAVHRYTDIQGELAVRHLNTSELWTCLAISFKLDVLGPVDQEIITMQTALPVCDELAYLCIYILWVASQIIIWVLDCLSFSVD